MKNQKIASVAVASVFAAIAGPAIADCVTTIDLRPVASQGGSDVVRLTNQGPDGGVPAYVSVGLANGSEIGGYNINFELNQTIVDTVTEIFKKAGNPLGYVLTNPPKWISVNVAGATSVLQGTVTNYQSKSVTPLLWTCGKPI